MIYTTLSRDEREIEVTIDDVLTQDGIPYGFQGSLSYENGTEQAQLAGEFGLTGTIPLTFIDTETGEEFDTEDEVDFGPVIHQHLKNQPEF